MKNISLKISCFEAILSLKKNLRTQQTQKTANEMHSTFFLVVGMVPYFGFSVRIIYITYGLAATE